jgi:argininosuccinate lyase
MAQLMLANIDVKKDILLDDKYKFLFSVEEVNKLVLSGVPFRDAYKQVGRQIEEGTYDPERKIVHTHEGSIGNPGLREINLAMNKVLQSFNFEKYSRALAQLLK